VASHIYTLTPDAMPAFDGHDPAVFVLHTDQAVRNGLDFQHGPISPDQAREFAAHLLRAAEQAEQMAARTPA